MPLRFLLTTLCLLLLSACVSQRSNNDTFMSGMLLAESEPVSPRAQMLIARYTDALYRAQLSEQERSEFLFQRGIAYDAIGLSSLARMDYVEAIKLNPTFAQAHNSVGVHYIQAGMYMLAYESFDASLEINPDYYNAYLNRGIALYYGSRSHLAEKDTQVFLDKDTSDPIRVIWHYIVQRKAHAQQALLELKINRKLLAKDNWASTIVDYYLGNASEGQVIADMLEGVKSQTQLNNRLCEAYFYLGKFHAWQGNINKAENYFKLSLSTNVYEYVEHKYSRIELTNLRQQRLDAIRAEQ